MPLAQGRAEAEAELVRLREELAWLQAHEIQYAGLTQGKGV